MTLLIGCRVERKRQEERKRPISQKLTVFESSSSILRDSDQADQSIPAARYLLLEYVRN